MPSFELILRSAPFGADEVRYANSADAVIGDVWDIDGSPWVITERQPPVGQRRIERLICVPVPVRSPDADL